MRRTDKKKGKPLPNTFRTVKFCGKDGLPLDGKALVKHAEGVVQSINKKFWLKFGNLYEVMVKNNFKRIRQEVIKDIFALTELKNWNIK